MNFMNVFKTVGSVCLMSACVYMDGNVIQGNREIVDTEITLPAFSKIRNNCSANVTYYKSDEYKVIITTDSNLIDFVSPKIDNEVLVIQTKEGAYSFSKLNVIVYGPELSSIVMSGSGNFVSKDLVQSPSFDVNINGSGDIKGEFEVKNFIANIRGSGEINITGKADEMKLTISGSGDFSGERFITNFSEIRINGSGDVAVHVNERLNVQIHGSGDVRYGGNPSMVNKNIYGAGRVVRN